MYNFHVSVNDVLLIQIVLLLFCFWQKLVDVVSLCLQQYCIDLPVENIKE